MSNYRTGLVTKCKIINEACRLFWEKGYGGTTLKEICENLGIRQSLLFHYFPNKAALGSFVLRRTNELIVQTLLEQFPKGDRRCSGSLRELVVIFQTFKLIHSTKNSCRFYTEVSQQVPELFYSLELEQSFMRILAALSEDANLDREMFLVVIFGMIHLSLHQGQKNPENPNYSELLEAVLPKLLVTMSKKPDEVEWQADAVLEYVNQCNIGIEAIFLKPYREEV